MNETEIEKIRQQLLAQYPDCLVKVAPDQMEMVAEISDGFAVAVIERSQPHFHLKMTEIYRVLRGTLFVAKGGQGFVLREGDAITIEPGQIHFAKVEKELAWVEVLSDPAWMAEDHFVL